MMIINYSDFLQVPYLKDSSLDPIGNVMESLGLHTLNICCSAYKALRAWREALQPVFNDDYTGMISVDSLADSDAGTMVDQLSSGYTVISQGACTGTGTVYRVTFDSYDTDGYSTSISFNNKKFVAIFFKDQSWAGVF